MNEILQTDIVQSLLEQANIMSQNIMALFLIIGLIAWVLYVIGSNFGSLLIEKLRASRLRA